MAFARFVTWKLKPNRRREALEVLGEFSEGAKGTGGFKGIFAFRSVDEPDIAYVLTFWDSEEALNAATDGTFKPIMESVSDISLEPPSVKTLEVMELAGQQISFPS